MPRPPMNNRRRPYSYTPKKCNFCRKKVDILDYKDVNTMQKYLTPWGKMKAGRDTGTCTRHQRMLRDAIKRARFMALLPYVKR